MAQKPALILQMRRMGDLILTFPLLLALQKYQPETSLCVVARPQFYKGLLSFAPKATFLPPEYLPELRKKAWDTIYNFGGSPQAAVFAGQTDANRKLGEILINGQNSVSGFWQLYRAALTGNNRHNLLHWADLNRMDWPAGSNWPRHTLRKSENTGKVGLFVGASEISKRPGPEFWAALVRRLSRQGLKPLILGGPGEKEIGEVIAQKASLKSANFCGKTDIAQLAHMLASLDLLITPDTGPMHLADWLGTPVLNLSMGNVNADETGPLAPGQLVIRAAMSCAGCWHCQRGKLYCHQAFHPDIIAKIAAASLNGTLAEMPPSPRLDILKTARDRQGLRVLENLYPEKHSARRAVSGLWKQAFLFLDKKNDLNKAALSEAAQDLARLHKPVYEHICARIANMPASLRPFFTGRAKLNDKFWKNQPPDLRFFAGWLHMRMENAENSRTLMAEILEDLSELAKNIA